MRTRKDFVFGHVSCSVVSTFTLKMKLKPLFLIIECNKLHHFLALLVACKFQDRKLYDQNKTLLDQVYNVINYVFYWRKIVG